MYLFSSIACYSCQESTIFRLFIHLVDDQIHRGSDGTLDEFVRCI